MAVNQIISYFQENEKEILHYSSVIMILFSVFAFILEMAGINVPYGRYANSNGKGWGPKIPARVAWVIMETPTLILMSIFFFHYGNKECVENLSNQFLISFFVIHYINRALIFPFRMSQSAPMPITVFLIAWLYVIWNSFTQSIALTRVNIYPSDWISNLRFLLGASLFVFGLFANIHADNTLLSLKAQKDKKNKNNGGEAAAAAGGGGGYQIPHGGLFEYVSCANYCGEIIEWTGYAIACWSLPATAFAIMTVCNLGPRAHHHHHWYHQKFENYPPNRKAVIPFIW